MLLKIFINFMALMRKIRSDNKATAHKFIIIFITFGLGACSSISEESDSELLEVTPHQNAKVTKEPNEKSQDSHSELTEVGEEENANLAETVKSPVAINLYVQQQVNNPVIVAADVRKDYQKALALMEKKKWQQASELFDKVITKQPQLSGSYVNKALIAKKQDKLAQAQLLLKKAVTVNKLNLYAYHLQGQIYRQQGEFDKAEQSYLSALKVWPDFAEAHASMAILLELYRGRLLDAYAYYDSYLQLKPGDEEIQRWQAGLSIKIKRAGLTIPEAASTTSADANVKSESQQSEHPLNEVVKEEGVKNVQ